MSREELISPDLLPPGIEGIAHAGLDFAILGSAGPELPDEFIVQSLVKQIA